MCKNVGRRRYCKFSGDNCIGLEDIARKREGGLEIAPPVGRGLKKTHVKKKIIADWKIIAAGDLFFCETASVQYN